VSVPLCTASCPRPCGRAHEIDSTVAESARKRPALPGLDERFINGGVKPAYSAVLAAVAIAAGSRLCPLRRLLHLRCQREVQRADTARVVRRQVDDDPIEGVGPLGVMVLPLCHERTAGHEGKGFGEVPELVLAMQLAVVEGPARERLQPGLYCAVVQLESLPGGPRSRLRARRVSWAGESNPAALTAPSGEVPRSSREELGPRR